MRKLHRLAVAAVAAASFCVAGAVPAQANHILSVCDSGDTGTVIYDSGEDVVLGGTLHVVVGTGEVYVRYGDALVGVDTDPLTVCVAALGASEHLSLNLDAPAGYVGVGLQHCSWSGFPAHTGSDVDCTWVVRVWLNTAQPLFSCVWVNNVQQIPACPFP